MLLDIHSEIYAWVRGSLLVLAICHFFMYSQNKRKLYLYYSLYLLAHFFFFVVDVEVLTTFLKPYINLDRAFAVLTFAAFFSFTRVLLETNIHNVVWDKYLENATKVLIAISLLFLFTELIFDNFSLDSLFIIVAPAVIIFSVTLLYEVFKSSGYTVKYYVLNFGLYLILATLSFLQYFILPENYKIKNVNSVFFIYLAAFIQSLFFAAILGKKGKEIEDNYKKDEIKLAVNQKQIEELKMTALQSQMNPHFLFNSLNSINNFVIKNDIEQASDYITKFSRLIRIILKSSSNLTVSLSEELGTLGLFVKLEQMRIRGFEYIVTIDPKLDIGEIQVPPLFLQPYVENSIWHGITHIEGKKRIELKIKKREDNLVCEIVDNGIGIKKAKKSEHNKISRRKFFGTQATESRIKLLHSGSDVRVKITDISNKKTSGTKVSITFPITPTA
ncbi:MAG: histidine kinase [Flavobacteriaceae bacterium]|nr:histidine kinase [Flavobacteriaceae bacterium]